MTRPGPKPLELYVAPRGDDANPGTRRRPFATVRHANEVAGKAWDGKREVRIHVAKGAYMGGDVKERKPVAVKDAVAGLGKRLARLDRGEAPKSLAELEERVKALEAKHRAKYSQMVYRAIDAVKKAVTTVPVGDFDDQAASDAREVIQAAKIRLECMFVGSDLRVKVVVDEVDV